MLISFKKYRDLFHNLTWSEAYEVYRDKEENPKIHSAKHLRNHCCKHGGFSTRRTTRTKDGVRECVRLIYTKPMNDVEDDAVRVKSDEERVRESVNDALVEQVKALKMTVDELKNDVKKLRESQHNRKEVREVSNVNQAPPKTGPFKAGHSSLSQTHRLPKDPNRVRYGDILDMKFRGVVDCNVLERAISGPCEATRDLAKELLEKNYAQVNP